MFPVSFQAMQSHKYNMHLQGIVKFQNTFLTIMEYQGMEYQELKYWDGISGHQQVQVKVLHKLYFYFMKQARVFCVATVD